MSLPSLNSAAHPPGWPTRGHTEFPGCCRCHDDNHKSRDGKIVRQNCELCHEIP